MRKNKLLILLLICLAACSCKRVKPQSPANQPTVDSIGMSASLINMRLAEAADIQLTEWVKHADTTYTLEDYGYWYCIYRHTDGDSILPQHKVELFYTATSLEGKLLEDCQTTIQVGRRESLWAIDHILPLMREGEAVKLICPYYTAYGKDGNDHVPPLQNCIIDITNTRIVE